MIPGPYMIVYSDLNDSGQLVMTELRHGYDTLEEAKGAFDQVVEEEDVEKKFCGIVRLWAGTDLEGGRE